MQKRKTKADQDMIGSAFVFLYEYFFCASIQIVSIYFISWV